MVPVGVAQAETAEKAARKRVDPTPRSIDGTPRGCRIKGADPQKKYVLVNTIDPALVEQYREDGWTSVERTERGARLSGGATAQNGQEQSYRGSVLMEIPLERWEQIQREGPEGGRGQEYADQIEAQILKPAGKNEYDPIRGRHGNNRNMRRDIQVNLGAED